MPKVQVPTVLVSGQDSPFIKQKLPQAIKKKLGIPFTVMQGGHMFPLEYPIETVELIKSLIQK